jgi:hypothetical protein
MFAAAFATITPELHRHEKRLTRKAGKPLILWWALKDLNLGPRDYEAHGKCSIRFCNIP